MTLRDALARFHAAITGAAPLASARDLVVRGSVDELERLHVYEHAYTSRIAGVLENDYPKLARLVDLRGLTAAYLRAHPPSHPSLREVGVHIAHFLGERGMPRHLADLASLERARTEVFDSADAVPLAREDLAELDPVEFPSLRLRLVPSSRVVAMTTNADDIWDAIENDREPAAPGDGSRVVMVWRREHTVVHRTLDVDEARVAHALGEGSTFGEVCDLLEEPAERAIALLVRWLDARCLRR
jgi:hypothetical protein